VVLMIQMRPELVLGKKPIMLIFNRGLDGCTGDSLVLVCDTICQEKARRFEHM
jgi:hypothetical protein